MGARLIAEIGADTAGFEAGLNRADRMVERFSHKVSHHLVKAFGYGFLATALVELPRKQIEAAEKISEGANKLHITTDEYQMLAEGAKEAGMEVGEFVQKNADQGVMLDSLIQKMGRYRSSIQMTREEISQWTEIKGAAGSFISGAVGPLGWLLRKGYNLGAVGLNLGGAILGSMANGFGRNFAGISTEDFLLEASRQGHLLFGKGTEGLQDTGGAALPLPAGHGKQKQYEALMQHLHVLQLQEDAINQAKAQMSARGHGHLFTPELTDLQRAGAFIRRPGFLLENPPDPREALGAKLDQIHKDMQETNSQLDKLRRGAQ